MKLSSTRARLPATMREQIGRFRERIVPYREVPVRAFDRAVLDEIAVGEEHGAFVPVGFEADAEARQHIRPVGKEGDAPEPFRLALGAVDAVRQVETGKLRIGPGRTAVLDRHFEAAAAADRARPACSRLSS